MNHTADPVAKTTAVSAGEFDILPEPLLAEDEICTFLREIRLPYVADEFSRILRHHEFNSCTATRILFRLVYKEAARRKDNRISSDIKKARFKYPSAVYDASLHDPTRKLDQDVLDRLINSDWADHGTNVIITGLTGAGKTHFACALGVDAILRGRKVRYWRASSLCSQLQKSELEGRLEAEVAQAAKWDLLIIDDFGLMKLDADMCRNLFEVIEARDQRKPTIIASQYPVRSWYDMFQDATYAEALLDRIVQQAIRLDMQGKNLREDPPHTTG